MHILVVGLSHKTAPVAMRERVAFQPATIGDSLQAMRDLPSIAEAIIVSTCNRVELIACSRTADEAERELVHFMADHHEIPLEELEPHLFQYQGADAIRHLFRVSSSLDSMVLGEPQILGQIKSAYNTSVEHKSVGLILNRFLHKAFSVAKRVRTETEIASNAVSVSFAAVELARKIFDDLTNKTVLLIGAGEMCELAARHFVNNGVSKVLVTNRTFARAEKLAQEFEGSPIPFDTFHEELHRADIVLSSTGADEPVLTREHIAGAIKQRKYKSMFLIDIAVPRDIAPEANDLDGIYLYDVDDLQGVVAANLKEREKEVTKAEAIIEEEIGQFANWLAALDVVPTIKALRERFDEVRQSELDKALSSLSHLGDKERNAVKAMTLAMMNKMLHQPMTVLKKAQNGDNGSEFIDAIRTLFDLPSPDTGEDTTS